jgi:hypothetical protein
MMVRIIHLLPFVILSSFCFWGINCKKEPIAPQPSNPLEVTVEDVSCTEAWLKVSLASSEPRQTDGGQEDRDVMLKRGDSTIATVRMVGPEGVSQDTLVLDTLLSPNTTYTYTLIKPAEGNTQEWQATAQVTTMATTSQNWEWTVERIGVTATSLYDVAIVNDTLAFAVGEINDGDTGTGEKIYNVAKWDGKKWELIKLPGSGGGEISAVFAISDNDVWFVSNYHWDGKTYQRFSIDPIFVPMRVNKLWGNSEELWAVGNNGGTGEGVIARRSPNGNPNGAGWQKIESGTTATLFDVWGGNPNGAGNKWLGENVVLVTSDFPNMSGHSKVLRIRGDLTVDTSLSMPNKYYEEHRLLSGTWFDQTSSLYISGSGVYRYNHYKSWTEENIPLLNFTFCIRGNSLNDIVVSSDGYVAHFNGVTWKVYTETNYANVFYQSIAIRNNLAIAVGTGGGSFPFGIIAIGKRK